ncbi:MAG: hypothetical protein ACLUHA_05015 [Bacteroides stercoris]
MGGTYAGSTHYYRVDLTSGGSYIPLKRNCRYIVNIKAVSNTGYATEAAALYGRQDTGNSNKRIGRSLGRTDSGRVGNDNHASKPGSMVADAEMPGSTGTIILL